MYITAEKPYSLDNCSHVFGKNVNKQLFTSTVPPESVDITSTQQKNTTNCCNDGSNYCCRVSLVPINRFWRL